MNAARLIGPVVAAALVGLVGIGWCFTIDALSYVAVLASLFAMDVPREPVRVRKSHVLAELVEGLAYVRNEPMVRAVLLLLAVTSMLGGSYSALLPAVAEVSLHGGHYALGCLMASGGAGALAGALYLASRADVSGLPDLIARCGLGIGGGLLALELAPSVWVAAPLLFVVGLSLMIQWGATNTLVQTVVDDDKLGRVMSLYAVAFFAGAPVGALIEGSLASWLGPIHAYAFAGAGCLLSSLLFRWSLRGLRAVPRPRYLELGLVEAPEP